MRDGAILLVASRYPNVPAPLWNLPGGRQRAHEMLVDSLVREFTEETQLAVKVEELLYVSESYDAALQIHVLNATFAVHASGEPHCSGADPHVVEFAWVPIERVAERLSVAVVREPLMAHLRGGTRGYYSFPEAGISIEFFDEA